MRDEGGSDHEVGTPVAPPPESVVSPFRPCLSRGERLFVVAGVILVAVVRFLPWRKVFVDGDILFGQTDAYYHLRRILLISRNFPDLPGIDRYMAYPYGAECPWPPLYDLVVACLAYIFSGFSEPSRWAVHAVSAFLSPVLAGMTVVPLYLVGRRLAGVSGAVASLFVLLVWPPHLLFTGVAAGDHHAAEVLLLATFLHLFIRSVDADDGREGAISVRGGFLPGLALGAVMLVWQASVVFAVVLAGGVFLAWSADRGSGRENARKEVQSALTVGAATLLVAAGVVATARALWPSETPTSRFDYGSFSWFQPFFLVAVAGAIAMLRTVERATAGRAFSAGGAVGAATLCAGVPALLLLVSPGVSEHMWAGLRTLSTIDPWLADNAEWAPPFGRATLEAPTVDLVLGLVHMLNYAIAPVVAVAVWWKAARTGPVPFVRSLFAFWTVLFALFAFRQFRWGTAFGLNAAIATGWVLGALFEEIAHRARTTDCHKSFLRRVAPWIAVLVAGVVLLSPYLVLFRNLVVVPWAMVVVRNDDVMTWIRENTPTTKGVWNFSEKPEYSILADWKFGHYLQYLAERPTVANNFGTQLPGRGVEDSLLALLAPDEMALEAICRERRVRYLLLTDTFSYFGEMPKLVGIDFVPAFGWGLGEDGRPAPDVPNAVWLGLPTTRLFASDGRATASAPGLSRFRLVYESPSVQRKSVWEPDGLGEPVKVFEFVPGAVLSGRTRPGGPVFLSVRLRSNAGRDFSWTTTATADSRGAWTARVPYATYGAPPSVVPLGPFVATTPDGAVALDVRDVDVARGGEINAPSVSQDGRSR